MPEMKEYRNFRWAYAAVVALAKKCLEDDNAMAAPGEWPSQQSWEQLGPTSRSAFMTRARTLAGIPSEEFLQGIREGEYDVEDIWEAGKLPGGGEHA